MGCRNYATRMQHRSYAICATPDFRAPIAFWLGLMMISPACAPSPPPPPSAHLEDLPLELVSSSDLGDVWANEGRDVVVCLRNRSGDPVQISQLTTSCDCAVASMSAAYLEPGETAEVRLLLTGEAPRTSKELRVVTLRCELTQVSQEFSLQFRRRGLIAIDNQWVTRQERIAPGAEFQLAFAIDPPVVDDVAVRCGDARFRVSEQVIRKSEGITTARLTLVAPNNLPGGTCRIPLLLESRQGGNVLEATVTATVEVAVSASLDPAFVRIDTSRDTTVESRLSIQSESPVRSVSIDSSGDVVALTAKEVEPRQWILVWSAEPISGGGLTTTKCVIRVQCENGDPILLSVPVSVYTPIE